MSLALGLITSAKLKTMPNRIYPYKGKGVERVYCAENFWICPFLMALLLRI